MARTWLVAAAAGGFLCVAFGAFAAHGVTDPRAQDLLRTGALYGFVHVLATYVAVGRTRIAPPLFLAGVLIFSGSLWAMALGAPRWLGAITPSGGLAFMTGWAALGWAALRPPRGEEV